MRLHLMPLPEVSRFQKVLGSLATILRRHDFRLATSLPIEGAPYHVIHEPQVLLRYLAGERNAHEATPFAPLYYATFARQHPQAYALYRLFGRALPVDRSEIVPLLGEDLFGELADLGALVEVLEGVRSRLLATPYRANIYFHDTRDIAGDEAASFVFLGRCSMRLADAVRQQTNGTTFRRALDLCTGSGVQALNVANRSEQVFGGDINSRALTYARANSIANGIDNSTFIHSDLFTSIEGKFDLITANTPFLLLEETSKATDGYGGKYGMEVALRIFAQLDEFLSDRGQSFIVASSAIVSGENMLVRKLRELYVSTQFEVDLVPVSEYFSSPHYDLYTSLGVDRCILYVVRVRRHEAGFTLREHDTPALVRAALKVHIARAKWHGRRIRGRAAPTSL